MNSRCPGRRKTSRKGGELIGRKITTDEPIPAGKYLGCSRTIHEREVACGPEDLRLVREMECDMEDVLSQCVSKCQELAGKSCLRLQRVITPFLDESKFEDYYDESEGEAVGEKPAYSPKGAAVPTTGELQPIACRVLMKTLYAARMARFDLLRPTCFLATQITRWSEQCDRKLHRLVCYIDSTLAYRMTCQMADDPSELGLKLYCDADFAGEQPLRKSTSGVYLMLPGPNGTRLGLSAAAKKQSCVSHIAPYVELISLDLGLRTPGLPALSWRETAVQRNISCELGGQSSDDQHPADRKICHHATCLSCS